MERRGKKYIPFGYKLMLSYFIFTLIIIVLISYIANSIFTRSIREQTQNIINGTLEQMINNITYKMDDVRRISDMLYFDNTLARHLKSYEEGWASYEATNKYLIPKFSSTVEATNRKLWLSIFLHNDTLPEIYSNYEDRDPVLTKMSLFDLYHIQRIQEKPWYLSFPAEQYGKTMQWKQIEDDEKYERISFLRRLVDIDGAANLPEIGFLRISVHLADLFDSVEFQKINENSTILVVDEDQRIIMSSSQEPVRPSIWQEEMGTGQLVLETKIPGLDWTLLSIVPLNILEEDVSKVRNLVILISIGCGIIFLMIGGSISRYYARKVSKIVSILGFFQEGSFSKRVLFKGNDEFTRIAGALNEMGQNIGELIRKVYWAEIEKKEAELEMMQAQINPHFLYNTLSSIHRLSKFGESDKLQQMVLDLAKFYRLSLSEGRAVIPISNELEQAEAYVNIQKIKYGDRLSITFEMDPEISQFDTLKLVIQPFVENCLEHAWCGDRIHIRIRGYLEEDNVVIKIIDDGIGIHPELQRQILDRVAGINVGYGMRNVHGRIALYYGESYGVRIYSRLGIGTAIVITFPTQRTKEGNQQNEK